VWCGVVCVVCVCVWCVCGVCVCVWATDIYSFLGIWYSNLKACLEGISKDTKQNKWNDSCQISSKDEK